MVSLTENEVTNVSLFGASCVAALILSRVYIPDNLPSTSDCTSDNQQECRVQITMAITLANAIFFSVLLLVGVVIRGLDIPFNLHKKLLFKLPLFAALHVLSVVFLPRASSLDFLYSCYAGAVIYLLIQIVLIIELAYSINEAWQSKSWFPLIIAATVGLFAASVALVVLEYHWFARGDECGTNIFLITFNICLIVIFSIISVLKVLERGALFPSAIIAVFVSWNVLTALMGTDKCNGLIPSGEAPAWMGIITIIGTLLIQLFNVSQTSTQASAFTGKAASDDKGEKEESPLFVFFSNLVFLTGAMYIGLQLTNWGDTVGKNIDGGKASYWFKAVTSWLTAVFFVWSLIAPKVLKNRDFASPSL